MLNAAKVKNRILSVIAIVVFAVGLVLITMVSAKLISESIEQQHLLDIRDQLLEEKEKQDNFTKDEDYYSVYVKDNYSIYDEKETIFVFTK